MYLNELKHKLRQLKKLEISIRFSNKPLTGKEKFIWDRFFSTKENDVSVRYPLQKLLGLNHQELKEIMDEYYYEIYYQGLKESGIILYNLYDPKLLEILKLPLDAGLQDIKKK
jgi:hypothetical protein